MIGIFRFCLQIFHEIHLIPKMGVLPHLKLIQGRRVNLFFILIIKIPSEYILFRRELCEEAGVDYVGRPLFSYTLERKDESGIIC